MGPVIPTHSCPFSPAIGGPRVDETPLARVSKPNALVNFSRPRRSHIIIDVREIYAAEKQSIMPFTQSKFISDGFQPLCHPLNSVAFCTGAYLIFDSQYWGFNPFRTRTDLPCVLSMVKNENLLYDI